MIDADEFAAAKKAVVKSAALLTNSESRLRAMRAEAVKLGLGRPDFTENLCLYIHGKFAPDLVEAVVESDLGARPAFPELRPPEHNTDTSHDRLSRNFQENEMSLLTRKSAFTSPSVPVGNVEAFAAEAAKLAANIPPPPVVSAAAEVVAAVIPSEPVQAPIKTEKKAKNPVPTTPAIVVETGFVLYVDCYPSCAAAPLEKWVSGIVDRICREAEVADLRLGVKGGKSDTLCFGAWKGVLAAELRGAVDQLTGHFTLRSDGEITAIACETLLPLARVSVRGCR